MLAGLKEDLVRAQILAKHYQFLYEKTGREEYVIFASLERQQVADIKDVIGQIEAHWRL